MTDASPKFKLRKILVAIDFSELSLKPLQYATALADRFRAGIYLLNVIEPTPVLMSEFGFAYSVAYDTQPLQRCANQLLSKWRKKIGSPVAVETALRVGIPWREIVAAASETHSDLIVIGAHGRTGLDHMMIASTAERVVRHALCPVTVVRTHKRDISQPVATKELRCRSENRQPDNPDRRSRSGVNRLCPKPTAVLEQNHATSTGVEPAFFTR